MPAATKLASPKTFWNLKPLGSDDMVRYSSRWAGKAMPVARGSKRRGKGGGEGESAFEAGRKGARGRTALNLLLGRVVKDDAVLERVAIPAGLLGLGRRLGRQRRRPAACLAAAALRRRARSCCGRPLVGAGAGLLARVRLAVRDDLLGRELLDGLDDGDGRPAGRPPAKDELLAPPVLERPEALALGPARAPAPAARVVRVGRSVRVVQGDDPWRAGRGGAEQGRESRDRGQRGGGGVWMRGGGR